MSNTYRFSVAGMHCRSCVLTLEERLREVPGVAAVTVDLAAGTAAVTGDLGNETAGSLAGPFSRMFEKEGYVFTAGSVAPPSRDRRWNEFLYAVPAAAIVILGFAALQKAGLVDLVGGGEVTYVTAFVIGVVASLSTCMAVVGGLTLSLSATFAKHGDRSGPITRFHVGRIAAFFVLGGVIGALGSGFRPSGLGAMILALAVAAVMFVMGLNLLDVFDWAKALQPAMPKFLARRAAAAAKLDHTLAPLAVGAATFFLPCGFTQAMQAYALTTGGFLPGALVMTAFVLGTLPVLALLSIGAMGMERAAWRGVFFKAAGVIVIVFALFNAAAALAAAGIIPPFIGI